MHDNYTSNNGFEANTWRRIHQTVWSRCFFVDVWLVHAWLWFFFPDPIVSHSKKKWQTLLCCFTHAMDQWQSSVMARGPVQMEPCSVYASRIRKLGATREAMSLYYCDISLWYCMLVWSLCQIWTATLAGLMFFNRIFCRQLHRFQVEIDLINCEWEIKWIERKHGVLKTGGPQHMKLCRLQPWAL